jgi:hypothetical protein
MVGGRRLKATFSAGEVAHSAAEKSFTHAWRVTGRKAITGWARSEEVTQQAAKHPHALSRSTGYQDRIRSRPSRTSVTASPRSMALCSTRHDDYFLLDLIAVIANGHGHLSDTKSGADFFCHLFGFTFRLIQIGVPKPFVIESTIKPHFRIKQHPVISVRPRQNRRQTVFSS